VIGQCHVIVSGRDTSGVMIGLCVQLKPDVYYMCLHGIVVLSPFPAASNNKTSDLMSQ
jgi:hypothetical protein